MNTTTTKTNHADHLNYNLKHMRKWMVLEIAKNGYPRIAAKIARFKGWDMDFSDYDEKIDVWETMVKNGIKWGTYDEQL